MRVVPIASIAAVAAIWVLAAASSPRSPVLRDVQGYAVATCLARQDNPVLKEQGQGWAQTVVERGHGDPAALRAVEQAVKATLAKGGVAVMRTDGPTPGDHALPVLTCGEIVDQPAVRVAVDKAVAKLSASYRRR